MKKLNVSFDRVEDTTGYLFSLTKCLTAVLYSCGYEEYAQDVTAASGFAFRTWAAADLCPSAMSIWEFKKQKPWAENCGLTCSYIERMWGEDAVQNERREAAVQMIRESVDNGVAAVAWDISGGEWGVITGYDETELFILKIDGSEDKLPNERLGQLDIPILSVLTVTGGAPKPSEQLIADTKALIASHLRGEEWCDNAQGLSAYDTIIRFVRDSLSEDTLWNLEYYLGTYAALRRYAWGFFEKYGEQELANLYETVHRLWQQAFELKTKQNALDENVREQIIALLEKAKQAEACVLEILQ